MKLKWVFAACLLALFSWIPRAEAQVSFQAFYDGLSPLGQWVQVDGYGYCWQPAGVDPDWRPYADGQWAYTDQGWMWISDEPWSWATYHYGRWVNLDAGWFWVPGYDWAPAWVSWQFSDDYCGWAPLPPSGRCGPGWYNFVPRGRFGDRNVRLVIIDRGRNRDLIGRTQHFSRRAGGPPLNRVNAGLSKPFQQLRVQRDTQGGPSRPSISGGTVRAYAPQVQRGGAARPQNVSDRVVGPRPRTGGGTSNRAPQAPRAPQGPGNVPAPQPPRAPREQSRPQPTFNRPAAPSRPAPAQHRNPGQGQRSPQGQNHTAQSRPAAPSRPAPASHAAPHGGGKPDDRH